MKSGLPKVEKRITVKDSKTGNIELYDSDNRYPQRTNDIINASGIATRCVETYEKYIIGGGFKDNLFYKAIINKKGLTSDKLLRYTAKNLSRLGGRAYLVNYNGLLQTSEVSHVPFEYCRIGSEKMKGMIAVYEDWECSIKNKIDVNEIKWYHRFTTDKTATLSQIEKCGGILKYPGQIYTEANYPLAPIDPVIEDAISDQGIKKYRKKEIDNGFNPSAIVRYTKEFDGDEGEKQWEVVMKDWKEFQGPDNAGKIMLTAGHSKEDFDVTRLDGSGSDKMYDITGKTIKKSIIENFGIPPSLLGSRDGNAVFSSQNIEDDTKFYNSITTKERLIIEEDMKILFSNFWIKVNETDDWSILELAFNAIATEKPSKISTLGIGGVQALMGVLASDMDDVKKINTIQIIFGFTVEEAQAMVLGTKITE